MHTHPRTQQASIKLYLYNLLFLTPQSACHSLAHTQQPQAGEALQLGDPSTII